MANHTRVFESSDPTVAWILGGSGLPAGIEPDHLALVWEGGERTYAQLRQRALSLAQSFTDLGLEPGDTVVSHLFNRGDTFEIYFACAYAGMTLVPSSFRLAAHELASVLNDSQAKLLFTESELAEVAQDARRTYDSTIPLVELEAHEPGEKYETMATGTQAEGPFPRTEPHLVLFSSGTTGKPKGIMLTHDAIMSYAFQQITTWPGYNNQTRLLVVPAMFNTGGINEITMPTFLAGGTVFILPSRGWSAERMAHHVENWKITHTVIFPTMFGPFFAADDTTTVNFDSLKVVITGGEACPAATMSKFTERWPHIQLLIGYGLTEGGLISWIDARDLVDHPGSVGRVSQGQTVKIADEQGRPLPQGSVGEIMTASKSVTAGYWNAPDLTAEVLIDGWLKTGDLGRVDDEGYLYIEGRSRDMIISKGQNIFPAEIEAVLAHHESIHQAAVIGIPDDECGEAVCAVVVVKAGRHLNAEEVIAFVGSRIASYKKPRYVRFRSNLPIGVSNKIGKRELAGLVIAEMQKPERARS